MNNQPRPNLVPTSSPSTLGPQKTQNRFPHESTSSPRPLPMQGRGRGRGGNLVPSASLTQQFTASTCPKCGDITITGTTYGLHLHLEPHMLNDQTEYNALHDQVPTYDLWPDRIARRRHHAHITHPTRVPRHAQHTCGTTYGTTPRPTPPAQPHAAPHSDTPPF
jgi:hypothetical protein